MSQLQSGTVFISHSSEDREFVEREILELLQNRGIRTWYSTRNISTADEWQRTILSGLQECDRFLVVLSPRAVESRWVQAEVAWAAEHRWPVIPVLMEACDSARLHLWLSQLQYVDFERNAGEAREKLLQVFPARGVQTTEALAQQPIRVPLFHFGGVVPPEYFVGRDRQLQEAERIIRGGQNFLLVGHHRDGKTSLCKMLIHRMMSQPANTVLAVYINVQQWPNVDIETFLEHTILGMIGEIGRQVFQCKFTSLRDFDLDNAPARLREDDFFRSFLDINTRVRERTFFRKGRAPDPFRAEEFQYIHRELLEIIQGKGWSNCVVFYDEANRLTEIPVERLVSHEEALTVPGRVSVYAATPAMAKTFGRLKDTFAHEVLLKPFDQEDVKQLLSSYWCRAAEKIVDLPVTVDAVERIWKLTRGQPYRVQLLAGGSFAAANERGDSVVSCDHVVAAHDRLKKEKPGEFAGDAQ